MVRVQRVELAKGPWGFGFSLGGGVGSEFVEGDTGIYVSKIIPGGPAEMDGRMEVGDKILSVGGESLTHYYQDQAVELLRNAPEIVIINVLKHQAEIELEHTQQKKLNASLQNLEFNTNKDEYIVSNDGRSQSVQHYRSQEIWIGNPPITPQSHVLRPDALPITPQVNIGGRARTPQGSFRTPNKSATPNQSYNQRGESFHSQPMNGTHHSNSLRYETPAQRPQHSHSFQQVPQQAYMQPQQQHSPANGVSHPRKFQLEKGGSGLGFNVVGGEGGEGIYVSNITQGGVADLSGLIFKGDQLLEVNGVNLVGATHEFAVSTLKSSGRIVTLVCSYKPEEFNRFKARVEAMAAQELNNNQYPPMTATGLRPDLQNGGNYPAQNGYPGSYRPPGHHGSNTVHFGQKEKSTGCCPWLS